MYANSLMVGFVVLYSSRLLAFMYCGFVQFCIYFACIITLCLMCDYPMPAALADGYPTAVLGMSAINEEPTLTT